MTSGYTRRTVPWLTALVLWLACAAGLARADSYSFGIVPQFEAMRLASIWIPILDDLEARTGHHFEMSGSPDIPAFERGFEEGAFDFAYLNPYHAVVAMERQAYQPLIRDGGRDLFGVLVVQKDSPVMSPEQLEGQAIAFPAPNALGASLLIRADLENRFALHYDSIYASTHSSAYLNVVLGRAAAAGGVMATFNSQPATVKDALRIIYETTHVPPHPVVAHPRVPAAVREAVAQALLDMAATPEGQALLAEVPIQKAVRATAEDYHVVHELGLERFVE